MKKKIIGLVLCMLLIIPVLSISCEAKKMVFINGRSSGRYQIYADSWTGKNPFLTIIKANQSFQNNFALFNFTKGPIVLIVNGIPRLIIQPASIKIGLNEPKTFAVLKFFISDILHGLLTGQAFHIGARVFSVCDDSIEVTLY
jgi:hypothetical protein